MNLKGDRYATQDKAVTDGDVNTVSENLQQNKLHLNTQSS